VGLFSVRTTYHRPPEASFALDAAGKPPKESEETPNIPGIIAAAAAAIVTVLGAISPIAQTLFFNDRLERAKLANTLEIEQQKLDQAITLEANRHVHTLAQDRAKEQAASAKDKTELIKAALAVTDCRQWMRNLRLLSVVNVIATRDEDSLRASLPECPTPSVTSAASAASGQPAAPANQ
jgi:hypothetical protein